MKQVIPFSDFDKIDLRVGKIINCVKKEDSNKLLRLTVDFGEEGTRNILTGLSSFYEPAQLKGKEFIFVINLEPRKLMGEESQGMLLCTSDDIPLPLKPKSKSRPGAPIS